MNTFFPKKIINIFEFYDKKNFVIVLKDSNTVYMKNRL